ncbi:MAG: UvrD-helicase domain-containing protein [Leptospiraceae bacterium]|nr:UvrD-helicase domain-containing protein [Leptospiraceae bacterium]
MKVLSNHTFQLQVVDDLKNLDLNNHLWIEASAGTGKTYTILRLFLRYVLEKNVDFRKILLVTFTTKATQEMQNRLRELIQKGITNENFDFINYQNLKVNIKQKLEEMQRYFDQIHISTIHSFCRSVLREYPFELNLPSFSEIQGNSNEVDESIINKILLEFLLDFDNKIANLGLDKSIFEKLPISKLNSYLKKFITFQHNLVNYKLNFVNFDETIDSEDVIQNKFNLLKNEDTQNIVKLLRYFYEQLQEYKRFHGVFSFDDLIINVYEALKENQKFTESLQNTYQIGIIDEFQDTNPRQWEIFKTIFLEKKGNLLVVVGDPKQAIYGFRGGDIYTYLKAKEVFRNNNAKYYQLNKNFRSTEEFIESTNKLFGAIKKKPDPKAKVDQKQQTEEIIEQIFHSHETQKGEKNENHQKKRNCKENPLNFVGENKNEKADEARNSFAKFIVKKVKSLVSCGYSFSEIAILYRSNHDAIQIKQELLLNEIPFVDYSEESIFKTNEALAVEFLLEFLAFPDKPSVRNRFFVYYFLDLPYAKIEEIDTKYSFIQERIAEWKEILQAKSWYKLFYKILEDTKLFYKYLAMPDYERKISNFEHLIEILVNIATINQLGPVELYQQFLKLKSQNQEEILRVESDDKRIHMMTIHKSKGLEFPIVFVSGWYDDKEPSAGDHNNYRYYDTTQNQWNICFFHENKTSSEKNDKPEDTKTKIRLESKLEELRLLYVAITRAKDHCYVVYRKDSNFFKTFFNESDLLNFYTSTEVKKTELTILQEQENVSSASKEEENSSDNDKDSKLWKKLQKQLWEKLQKLEMLNFHDFRWMLHSYTSLTQGTKENAEMDQEDYDKESLSTEENLVPSTSIFDSYFPAGSKTGIFFHKVMEILDFADFRQTPNNIKDKYERKINYYLELYGISKNEGFDDFFYDFLNEIVSIPIPNKNFSLKDIDMRKTKKEIEFLIQNIQTLKINSKNDNPIFPNSFLTGNIVLFFEHNQEFYLLDYKTTLLTNYNKNTLEEYTNHHYKTQYLLYSYALYLWLNQLGKHTDISAKLPGGIIYFYVRGYKSDSKGIYFREFPTFDEIKKELTNISS